MRLVHRLSRLKSDHCPNFIWGASKDTCRQQISNGGLLLRQSRDHNVSIIKFGFNSITNTYAFGVRVMRKIDSLKSLCLTPTAIDEGATVADMSDGMGNWYWNILRVFGTNQALFFYSI
ncbi:hypothetical protein J1N35_045422 [Gossypium stocksii]|uniref:Uncharacterized protein n=1 Tax=Gossypium stocksii TaxID=47602 RepID=A0A9D3ZHD3_9ROSI|nr:hypothetical protein J1N35_045422 [Gossypium stocksii]